MFEKIFLQFDQLKIGCALLFIDNFNYLLTMFYLSEQELKKIFLNLRLQGDFVFLDSSRCNSDNTKSFLFTDPLEILQFSSGDCVADFFAAIEEKLSQGKYVAGSFNYEFGLFLEERLFSLSQDYKEPLASFGVFESPKVYDHLSGENDFPLYGFGCDSDSFQYVLDNVVPDVDYAAYAKAIGQIKEFIAAGDTYQVNYTFRLLFELQGAIEPLYLDLRRNQTVSYGAYLKFGDQHTLSFSPELFYRKQNNSLIMKPMKGTVKKGVTGLESTENSEFLQNDLKNRSENVMIVDMLRNDLARFMFEQNGGKVSVPAIFEIEEYESLLQMTSTVSASPDPVMKDISLQSLFRAIFPCGSITGAPKIRTMQIIDQLEQSPRGVYTGAIGFFAPDGDSMFNVPIRTIVYENGQGMMGVGSGVVADSEPETEWQESLLKAKFLTEPVEAFELIETILWLKSDGFFLLQYHLDRLVESARFFNFVCDVDNLVNELGQLGDEFARNGHQAVRLRLTLAKNGNFGFTNMVCDIPKHVGIPAPVVTDNHETLPEVAFHDEPVDTSTAWFYHKTTRRGLFDQQFVKAQEKGLADILFVNTRGEATEGCVSNIIIFKKGSYYTPPLSSGILDGVMRKFLIADAVIGLKEKRLTPEDLKSADALYICNSIRGVRQVTLKA